MMSKKFRRFALLAIVVLGLAACTERQSPIPTSGGPSLTVQQPVSPGRQFPVQTGDTVQVIVFNQVDLSGEHIIPVDGFISLPLIGSVVAGGKSVKQIETDITQSLKDNGFLRDPNVTVRVLAYRPVSVIGGVNRPGNLPYQPGMRVIDAIAAAGDYSAEAITTKPPFVIRASSPNRAKEVASVNDFIFPGDIIEIPATRIRR
ncbi:MAG: polysaccharide biosynthesis/export family protein [Alphaproteobacteria bacterium]